MFLSCVKFQHNYLLQKCHFGHHTDTNFTNTVCLCTHFLEITIEKQNIFLRSIESLNLLIVSNLTKRSVTTDKTHVERGETKKF